MKLYMAPGSCSTGIHILLEELDLPFEAHILNLPAGEHLQPEYVALNPKSTIPTLVRNDGRVLTEFQAIAYWLARQYPKAKLLPGDAEGDARALEIMDYVVGTVHGQGYTRIFVTESYTDKPEEQEAVKARGRDIVAQGFAILDQALAGKEYALDTFSIADAALFYVEFWAAKIGIALPANCQAHYQRMRARPVVQRVLAEEGYR